MSKKIAFSMGRDNEGVYHFSVALPSNAMVLLGEIFAREAPKALDLLATNKPELALYVTMLKQSLGFNESKESEPS